ncbi:heterokaryon incompatibility protein-domain-containing protein [Xylogone sp. PMI_703]|nr:heterokaryon incompatibility protein-domain-containing protein [Xylogone sp. PMI_703]
MDAVRLCEFCSKIDFERLRNPLLSDLPAVREGRVDKSRRPFKDTRVDTHKPTTLGPFSEILRRSKSCRLCQLIVFSLTRHVANRLSDEDVCEAETTFFGGYRDPQGENYWLIRRLSIIVDISTDVYTIGGPNKSLFHAFQACNIGAGSIQVDEEFTDPRPEVDMMVFGGRQRPILLDLRWVQRWMDICKTDHGIACESADISSKHTLKKIRFVDVEQMCIVTLEDSYLSDQQYIALSYVWGGEQKLKLERKNKDDMAKPNVLATKHLPQTIEDAVLLTKSLKFRYLWIDALCIIQDDDGDKGTQVGAMSQIYGFASLTIMAAAASSVEGGLPGLRPGSRSLRQEEVVVIPGNKNGTNGHANDGLSLMTTLQPLLNPNEHHLERTPWNSRGWTMQERVLSRRVLVFMPEQVYWVCRETTFCEESYFENDIFQFHRFHERATELTLRRSFRNFYEPDDDQLRFWKTYQNLVSSYTRRTFTYQGDAFDGFLAVLQGLSALSGDDFAWGLPRSHFEQGLLWTSFTGVRRRRELSTLPMTSFQTKVSFPSWSWMGWIGEVFVCIGDDRCDEDIGEFPEILCFEHYHAPLRLERIRHKPAPYDSTGWRDTPSWKRSHDSHVTLADLEVEHSRNLLATLRATPEKQLIFFWTSSAFFTLARPDNNDVRHSDIVDSSGNVVGSTGIMMSEEEDCKSPSSDHPSDRHEFVVLGSRRNQFSDPMLLVLQIGWLDGIAYRVNCGEVKEEAWERESHTWKLIPLG